MSDAEDFSFALDEFRGVARLFPLPNLVMFPRVMQPLHIFEPRYRQLFEEALQDDKLFALAVLAPGWEQDYEGRPPLHPIACLCRVATHQALPDGCYNVLLIGVQRIRLKRELPPTKLFREAEVELLGDIYAPERAAARAAVQRELVDRFKLALPKLNEIQEQLEPLLTRQVPLGLLVDMVSYTLKLPLETKLELLSEADVDRRAEMLLELMSAGETPDAIKAGKFPPDFSQN